MKLLLVSPRCYSVPAAALLIVLVAALVPSSVEAQEYKFTVPASQLWTDTGVDLQAGSTLALTATPAAGGCDPAGVAPNNGSTQNLPIASANPGALIARLQENGPISMVGTSQQLRTAEAGHLLLGVNSSGTPPCQGSFAVKVQITPGSGAASANAAAPASGSATQPKVGAEKEVKDIKGALTTAAQTWLSGQFGAGAGSTQPAATPGSSSATASGSPATAKDTSPATPALTLSTTAIDSQLRQIIDGLPRRVNDQFQNQGDMVNFVIVGPLQKVQEALAAADWNVADRDVKESVMKAVLQTYEKKAYLGMPMSELYLFGRVQDYGYEQAEPYAVVASRHHFRIWKAPVQWNGQDVWVGAGTHDIGFEKDQRNGKVTHKIDPAVDGERDNIGGTLQKGGKVKSLTYYLPPNPVQDAKNATGGGYHSDGRVLVIKLQ
jgi:LssY C-terminus